MGDNIYVKLAQLEERITQLETNKKHPDNVSAPVSIDGRFSCFEEYGMPDGVYVCNLFRGHAGEHSSKLFTTQRMPKQAVGRAVARWKVGGVPPKDFREESSLFAEMNFMLKAAAPFIVCDTFDNLIILAKQAVEVASLQESIGSDDGSDEYLAGLTDGFNIFVAAINQMREEL